MLSLDPTTGRAEFDGVTAQLTKVEGRLLSCLIKASPVPCNSDELLKKVWGYAPYTGSKTLVRTHVYHIRKKLGADCILTKVGWGYYCP